MTYFTRLLYNYTSKIEHKVKVIAWANWNSQSQKNLKQIQGQEPYACHWASLFWLFAFVLLKVAIKFYSQSQMEAIYNALTGEISKN